VHVVVVENRALYVSSGSDGDGSDPCRDALRVDDAALVGSLIHAISQVDLESTCVIPRPDWWP
jgi:hypothetical protein